MKSARLSARIRIHMLAIFALTYEFPNFMRSLTFLAFIRVIRKSRSARYCQSIQWHVYIYGSRCEKRVFFFPNCPTIGMLSARTNNYLIACF